MSESAKQLLANALQLPEAERAAVAGALIESLHDEPEAGVRSAWEVEVGKRVQELDSGSVQPVSDSAARASISGREH